MASLKFKQRKAVEVSWDTASIKGQNVSIQAAGGEVHAAEEKRNVANDGQAVVTFPHDFVGASEITVRGSVSGEATAVVNVT